MTTFFAEKVGEVMHYFQYILQPDASEFVKALVREINGQEDNKNWMLVDRSTVPEGLHAIPLVWLMRCNKTKSLTK